MSFITLSQAQTMTADYRSRMNTILDVNFQNQDILPVCETFDRSDFDDILRQSNCTQIRIYFGMDSNLQIRAIVVAADANDDDILPSSPTGANQQIVEMGRRCPTACPRNPL